MFASKAFVLLLALGAFGPGIAREMGWFKDHDEFQRHAAHRAGYHAYLFSGVLVAMFAVVVALDTEPVDTAEILRFVLVASWIAWMFSSLLEYWGARRTTSRVLLVFGFFWMLFVAANFVSPDAQPGTPWWEHVIGFLFGTSIVALFFIPAWGAYRKPRLTGWILLGAGVGLTIFLSGGDNLPWTTRLMTNTMLMVPMIVCGPCSPDRGPKVCRYETV